MRRKNEVLLAQLSLGFLVGSTVAVWVMLVLGAPAWAGLIAYSVACVAAAAAIPSGLLYLYRWRVERDERERRKHMRERHKEFQRRKEALEARLLALDEE